MRRVHPWANDLQFIAVINIAMGLLMIFMPHERTTGQFYAPARQLLAWTGIYPFYIYGPLAVLLGVLLFSAVYRPVELSVALGLGVGYWCFWTVLSALGLLTAGDRGGLGLIVCLSLSHLRRHVYLFPTRIRGHELP